MEAFLFSIVIFAAIFVVARKKWQKRRDYEEYKANREETEGHTPAQAWHIHHPRDIDTYVRRERCHCKGKVYQRAESTVSTNPPIRVVVCECTRCEEVIRLYFEIDYLQ